LLAVSTGAQERKEEFEQVCASLGDDLRQAEQNLRKESKVREALESENNRLARQLAQAQEVRVLATGV